MNNLLILVLVVVVLVGGYYFYTNQNLLTAPSSYINQVTNQTPSSVSSSKKIDVILSPQNESNESGEVILEEMGGKLKVTLTMKGAPNVSQPAHIHIGACPTPGAVKYPLSPVVNGRSETILDTNLEGLKKNLPLAINVHKSDAESKVYVACGNMFTD